MVGVKKIHQTFLTKRLKSVNFLNISLSNFSTVWYFMKQSPVSASALAKLVGRMLLLPYHTAIDNYWISSNNING